MDNDDKPLLNPPLIALARAHRQGIKGLFMLINNQYSQTVSPFGNDYLLLFGLRH